ncbi:MAG: DMT family transporter [Anaerolineaceae bacterium]|nr:DMT family transporter [Anaerolineaceae bacterium]
MSIKNWLKFIALGIVWGSSFFWIKIGLQEVGPITVVFFRIFFALLGMSVMYIINRRAPLSSAWRLYLFLGVFNAALPFVLVSWSEKHITSGMASILNSLQPLTTSLIAAFFIKDEKLTFQRIAGLVLAFGGVLVLMSDKLNKEVISQTYGIIAMVIAVFCYGASSVFARLNNEGVKPEDQAFGQFAFGFLFIIPSMLMFESPFTLPVRPVSYLAFAWLGLLGSFFASYTWYSLLNEIGPSRVSMTTYLFPLVGVVLGALLLRESVDWRVIVGGLLILLGIVIVNKKMNNGLKRDKTEQVIG